MRRTRKRSIWFHPAHGAGGSATLSWDAFGKLREISARKVSPDRHDLLFLFATGERGCRGPVGPESGHPSATAKRLRIEEVAPKPIPLQVLGGGREIEAGLAQ